MTLGHTPWPAFLSGLYPLLIKVGNEICPRASFCFFKSQQISFGKKRTKRVACVVARGIANFCMQGIEAPG